MTKKEKSRINPRLYSGAEETRTLYLIAASDALSQVSYDPMCEIYCNRSRDSAQSGIFTVFVLRQETDRRHC